LVRAPDRKAAPCTKGPPVIKKRGNFKGTSAWKNLRRRGRDSGNCQNTTLGSAVEKKKEKTVTCRTNMENRLRKVAAVRETKQRG